MQSPHSLMRLVICVVLTFSLSLFSTIAKGQSCQSNNFAANQAVVANDGVEMAINVVDGNLTTDWFGGSDSKWIYVDLGNSKSLCKVTLKMGLWATVPQTVVQGSNDASTWTDLYTIAANASTNHVSNGDYSYDYIDVDLSATSTAYRYVRLYYPSGTSWGPHLKELEVYIKQTAASPTVTITRPTNGNTYLQGSTINIGANASEQGGTISKVEFFANNALLGQSLSAPFSFNWTNVQAGDYTIIAHAYDAAGQMTISNATAIHVNIPGWSLTGNTSTSSGNFIGTIDANPLIFKTNNQQRLKIASGGMVTINEVNDANLPADAALAVNGYVYAKKLTITKNYWADFVFDSSYKLQSLSEVEKFINVNKHLPGVPSEKQVTAEGINVGDNQAVLLQKIEELTLYMIGLHKEIEKLKQQNAELTKLAAEKK